MIDDQPADEHWLTYTEAAERLGLTVNAVRALARRQGWPRRSPNVIGGQAWVAVPATRLSINGRDRGDRRSNHDLDRDRSSMINDQPPQINGHDGDDRRSNPAVDHRSYEILTAVQEVAERIAEPLRERIADLKNQLASEKLQRAEDRERTDYAEERAKEAEGRVRELQQKLEAEMIEHRRVVGLLAEKLSARRSWRLWRR
jgi:hypothetical protein